MAHEWARIAVLVWCHIQNAVMQLTKITKTKKIQGLISIDR